MSSEHYDISASLFNCLNIQIERGRERKRQRWRWKEEGKRKKIPLGPENLLKKRKAYLALNAT